MNDLRIIFMGTPYFAVPSLKILIDNGFNVVAVVTATDKYGGRGGKKLLMSPVKKIAVNHDIPVLQPPNLKKQGFIDKLASYKANLQIVVAFRMLPEVVWNMPEYGTINLHGSLLPKYRGAAPINWAIILGEKVTGVTSFRLKHKIDTGDVILQKKLNIGTDESAGELHDRMMILGAEVVLDTVQLIADGEVQFTSQDDTQVTKAPKIFHEDCEINFAYHALQIKNFVRGLSPYPGAWTTLEDKEVKIYKCEIEKFYHNAQIGSFMTDHKHYLKILCTDGAVSILDLKMAGKKRMDIKSFLNGFRFEEELT